MWYAAANIITFNLKMPWNLIAIYLITIIFIFVFQFQLNTCVEIHWNLSTTNHNFSFSFWIWTVDTPFSIQQIEIKKIISNNMKHVMWKRIPYENYRNHISTHHSTYFLILKFISIKQIEINHYLTI